ncbi:MAG: PEP-CTERM sorting domain-containing protein [Pirellulaceae bacterium]
MKNARVLFALIFVLSSLRASYAAIEIDYTHDTFFNGGAAGSVNARAKAALEAAVADINAVLDLSSFGAITAAQHQVQGTNATATVTFDFDATYSNPSTGAAESIDMINLQASEIRIFVGMRVLNDTVSGASDITLGQGGLGGFSLGIGASSINNSDIPDAVVNASNAANPIYNRGDGPVANNFSGTAFGGAYDVDLGVTHGNLWFDADTNNDNDFDTLTELDADWHFDHTTAVAAGKNDFYSVALHETLHAIGYGASDSWDALVNGTEWTGAEAIAANGGSGLGLIDGGGAHLATTVTSTRISDGMSQAPVMSPSITTGTRKTLTELDVAVLRDIGFSVSAVPEPSSFALLAFVGGVATIRRRRC